MPAFEKVCDVYNTPEGATMWLLKHYASSLIGAVIEAQAALPTETTKSDEGYLTSLCLIMNYSRKEFAAYNNIVAVGV